MNIDKLKGLMREKGFTQTAFSEQLGLTRQALAHIVKVKKTDTDTLLKMCEILNVEPQILLK